MDDHNIKLHHDRLEKALQEANAEDFAPPDEIQSFSRNLKNHLAHAIGIVMAETVKNAARLDAMRFEIESLKTVVNNQQTELKSFRMQRATARRKLISMTNDMALEKAGAFLDEVIENAVADGIRMLKEHGYPTDDEIEFMVAKWTTDFAAHRASTMAIIAAWFSRGARTVH